MPGIAGLISRRPPAECERIVNAMILAMVHEPFYRRGTHFAPELGVYGGWVTLSEAPAEVHFGMGEDRVLLRSGEMFLEESELEKIGTGDDGDPSQELLRELNGLFSGLLVDHRRSQAFLFNDRYGFDRLYLAQTGDDYYFASEAKALLRVLPETRGFAEDGVADFLSFGCTAENRTLFRGIHLLPGGSIWTFRNGQCQRQRYFTPTEWESQPTLDERELQTEFDRTFESALPKYFANPKDLGVSLTAGLDSRLVMAGRPHAGSPICYTYEGGRGETRDARLARNIAHAAGYDHRLVRLGADFFADFSEHFERTVLLTDGTFGATGAHELYLSRAARSLAPIRLTGVFGGEILRGVSTFNFLRLDRRLLSHGIAARKELPTANDHPVTAAAFKEIPWSIFGSLAACRSQLRFRTPYLDNDVVALAYRIPATQSASSEAMLGMIRRKDPTLATIPTDMGLLANRSPLTSAQRLFARATFKLEYWCNDGMPHRLSPFESIMDRVSAGVALFGRHKYLRYRRWFRRELADYLRDALNSASIRESGFWEKKFIDQLAEAHIAGRGNFIQEISAVLTLDAVQRLLLGASNFVEAETVRTAV